MNAISEPTAALQVVDTLFHRLNEEDVRYCHWKSTHRLPRSIKGDTDLDILVDRSHGQRFKQILYECDFKPFISHPSRQFPAIEDYLGFDAETGRLIHLHIHYRLVLGEQYAKNYYLPLEKSFLDNTQFRLGIKVPAPELELIVLVMRALLKYRDRDVLHDLCKFGDVTGIPPGILNECQHLLAQTGTDRVMRVLCEHANLLPADVVVKFLSTIQKSPRDGWSLYWLRRCVRQALAPYQRYSRWQARLIYYRVMLARQKPFDRVLRRFFLGQDKRKIPVSGGLTIAFVGADGAGKSTVIKHIVKWLSWRLNVQTYYMGSTQPSLITKPLGSLSKLTQHAYSVSRRVFGQTSMVTSVVGRGQQLVKYLRYLSEGNDRYRRYRVGRRKAAQGSIIIYDRYPLEAVRVFNRAMDGPRIPIMSKGHVTPMVSKLAEVENLTYRKILPAEHVFVLHVSPEVSQARKPEHKRKVIEVKSRAIEQIKQNRPDVTQIDADQPLDQVLLQVKSTLWRLL